MNPNASQPPPSRWILLLALTAVTLNLCWKILAPFLSVVLWATVLVMVFSPVHQYLLRRVRNQPSVGAFLATVLVLAVIILPLAGITTAVLGELQATLGSFQGRVTQLLQDPKMVSRLPEALQLIHRYTGLTQNDLRQAIQQAATGLSNYLIQGTMNVVGGAVGFVVNLSFVTFTMFFLFRDGEQAVTTLLDYIPLSSRDSRALVDRAAEIISASIYGVFVIAVVQGTLGGVMFWLLGLPQPLLWGVVMIILATVPVLGTFVVWVPAAIYLGATGLMWKAVLLALFGTLVIGTSDNLLRPVLVGQRAQMHELLIFFSVLGGLRYFGFLGLLMGPVLVAITTILLEAFRRVDLAPQQALSETAPVVLVPLQAPEEPPEEAVTQLEAEPVAEGTESRSPDSTEEPETHT